MFDPNSDLALGTLDGFGKLKKGSRCKKRKRVWSSKLHKHVMRCANFVVRGGRSGGKRKAGGRKRKGGAKRRRGGSGFLKRGNCKFGRVQSGPRRGLCRKAAYRGRKQHGPVGPGGGSRRHPSAWEHIPSSPRAAAQYRSMDGVGRARRSKRSR